MLSNQIWALHCLHQSPFALCLLCNQACNTSNCACLADEQTAKGGNWGWMEVSNGYSLLGLYIIHVTWWTLPFYPFLLNSRDSNPKSYDSWRILRKKFNVYTTNPTYKWIFGFRCKSYNSIQIVLSYLTLLAICSYLFIRVSIFREVISLLTKPLNIFWNFR